MENQSKYNAVYQKRSALILVLILVFFAAISFMNLTEFPLTWYDEGSHLHVPKALIKYGEYADISSEGVRYYGPTQGIGPTVIIPIAFAFKLFGIGLLQARVVMVLYMIAAIFAFYKLARQFGNMTFAVIALLLVLSSRGVSFIEYGRQVLGEVPGIFFIILGLSFWFVNWGRHHTRTLVLIGVLFGFGIITKYQYLLIFLPWIFSIWLLNVLYYKTTSHRTFIIPGVVATFCFILWQLLSLVYLGPATIGENLRLLSEASAGAAFVFSPNLMIRGIKELLSLKVYMGAMLPFLFYGAFVSLPRDERGQKWGVVFVLVAINLIWYIFASISWLRYAFPALVFSSLLIAKFFSDATEGFALSARELIGSLNHDYAVYLREGFKWSLILWLMIIIVVPLAQVSGDIVSPQDNYPAIMANYLEQVINEEALIETWEPEMGFLTDHNYHYPPHALLNDAVGQIWLGKPPVSNNYSFVEEENPEFILLGEFAKWTKLYSSDFLDCCYKLLVSIGPYDLYEIR